MAKIIDKIRVRCSGHLHEIGITKKGQFAFFNHTKEEIKSELTFAALGGEPCRCVQVLMEWRYSLKEGKVSCRYFSQRFSASSAVGYSRRRRNVSFLTSRKWQINKKIEKIFIKKLFDAVSEEKLYFVGIYDINSSCIQFFDAVGKERLYFASVCGNNSPSIQKLADTSLRFFIPTAWCRVYNRKMWLADGHFIFQILEEQPDGAYCVLGLDLKKLDSISGELFTNFTKMWVKKQNGTWHIQKIEKEGFQ